MQYLKQASILFILILLNACSDSNIPIESQGAGKARAQSSRGAYTQYVSNETSAQHSQNLKGDGYIWNSPRPEEDYSENVRYSSFPAALKTLDPAESYEISQALFLAQIYESPLQYHYLKRPYTLVPLTAADMPKIRYWDQAQNSLPDDAPASQVAYTTYDITIKPNIFYQPHPAFARNKNGHYLYHHLTPNDIQNISELRDFPQTGTRELIAEDYVYEIKRLAHPEIVSPIFGLMSGYILDLSNYAKLLQDAYKDKKGYFFDLRKYPLEGAKVIDKYSYRITLKGKYPQFSYWLTMSFFSPVPWEADYFYSQPGMKEKNLTLRWQPVGTGAYFLSRNNPNKEMVLQKNPYFHTEYFPTEGEPGDKENGYLKNAGQKLPFIDKYVFTLEKEVIPRWGKFLQGYYDQSGISSDNYGEAIQLNAKNTPELTPFLKEKGIQLFTQTDLSVYYFGFNMSDDVVGGYSDSAKKLRQAIGIAIDTPEYISIFMNGRGIIGHDPLPPGVFGYFPPEGNHINTYLYNNVDGKPVRKSLEEAKKLLAEAGYPNGRDIKTGKPLVIRYDATTSTPADQDQSIWLREQFAKLGIELDIDATDYNRFQEKIRNGDTQFFMFGWVGDYPDPENFLFLFYGPNAAVKHDGINATNYANKEFDDLFTQMEHMSNNEERLLIIQQMIKILQNDSPWIGQVFSKTFILAQPWVEKYKLNAVANNILKYQKIYPEQRARMIVKWNHIILWPIALLFCIIFILILPAFIEYWRKMHRPIKR